MTNPTGYTALDLVGFTDRGPYVSNVPFVKNDIVHYGGNLWKCKIDDTTNVTPAEGANWTLFIGEPTNLVERIIAPLEENPATVAYAVGRQIIYDDYLWEVIDDIAIGDPLVDYDVDPTNANIKKASPVETQLLEVKAKQGNLASLLTTVKTTLVAAINELVGKIGDLTGLATTAKASTVAAINELVGKIGDLTGLTTTAKTSAVAAINELDANADAAQTSANNAQQMIAPILSSLVAPTGGLASGDQFIYQGLLYKATAAIASGGTITIGGNCALAGSVTGQIEQNKNAINNKLNSTTRVRSVADGRAGVAWTPSFEDAIVEAEFGLNSNIHVLFPINKAMTSTTKQFIVGCYLNTSDNHVVKIECSPGGVNLINWYYNGNDISGTNLCKLTVYERG